MFEKLRIFASATSTDMGAAFLVGASEKHPYIAAFAVSIIVVLATNGLYHFIQRIRGCRPEMCKTKLQEVAK